MRLAGVEIPEQVLNSLCLMLLANGDEQLANRLRDEHRAGTNATDLEPADRESILRTLGEHTPESLADLRAAILADHLEPITAIDPHPHGVDWDQAAGLIRPLLGDPDDWRRLRVELERREVSMFALVGEDPLRPTAFQADSKHSGWRVAGIDESHPDPYRHALEALIEELDTPGGTPPGTPRQTPRPGRHGIGKKGRRNR